MISQFDYAALSAVVYNNVRGQDNKLTLPYGWEELPIYPNGIVSSVTGFIARAYSNGTQFTVSGLVFCQVRMKGKRQDLTPRPARLQIGVRTQLVGGTP